jgi:hypothetical protein
MRAWFIPSWNGDWRLQPDPEAPELRTILTVSRPTATERKQLAQLQEAFVQRDWLAEQDKVFADRKSLWTKRITIKAPLSDIGPIVIPIVKPGRNVLTAVRSKDGKVEVVEGQDMKPRSAPYRSSEPPPPEPADKVKELAAKPDAVAAATVRRPTPCCPDCYESAIKPATDVLLSFLDEEQHSTWAKDRYVVARGQYTRHRYLIAHRNSPIAARNTRLTFDLDDGQVMHFHDWTVPPEEEVLASMLILQHREAWLRNEATCLGAFRHIFKNPFGDGGDGVRDSFFTARVGQSVLLALGQAKPRGRRRAHGDVGEVDVLP